MTDTQVRPWSRNNPRPEMTFRTEGSPADAVEVIASGLTGVGFRLKDRSDAGFRATLPPWKDWMTLNPSERAKLDVVATPDGAQVLVRNTGNGHAPAKDTARGLNQAVAEFRRLGVQVSWSEWETGARR